MSSQGEEDLLVQPEPEDNVQSPTTTAAATKEGGSGQNSEEKRQQLLNQEFQKLEAIQKEMAAQVAPEANSQSTDFRSVYVGNVDYSTTPQELQAHFQPCGAINRITILCDKFTGHPKGYAYIEFSDESSVSSAVLLNESVIHGRQIKVSQKRNNMPGMSRGGYRGRARGYRGGFRGRGRGRVYYHPYQ
jgi:polyadenylate-binding protein 2